MLNFHLRHIRTLCSAFRNSNSASTLYKNVKSSKHQPTMSTSHNLWLPYTQMKTASAPIEVVRTEGVRMHLADGRTLIDGVASWWTACHGYNHPVIVKAIQEQAAQMPHVMLGGIVHPQAIKLAESLSSTINQSSTGNPNRVFLCDSGSVAVEVALKMAAQYWINQSSKDPSISKTKNRFVCFQDSYHGDTSGAMSVCDPTDGMHSHFKGFLLEQYPQPIPRSSSDFETFQSFLAEKEDQLAGVIIEPLVQMAAGMRFHSPETLTQIFKATQQHDLLFIVDEVATGFGRTGSMFAYHQAAEVEPHILCAGKGLTGASVGLAATIANDQVYSAFHSDNWEDCLMHGPTFMGNPIACAAANASIELFESEPRLEQVATIESILTRELQPLASLTNVAEVNCLGALGAVRLNQNVDVSKAIEFFVSSGVWIRPINDTVYIAPAFTIDEPELQTLCDAVKDFVLANL